MSVWGAVTWDTARAGGFVAYGLITLSVALGLALSLKWRSRAWPRWATNDLHRYVALLALVFTGIHTLAVWLDPFMAYGPAEIFVPLVSHYRPLWMAFGIVAAYLLVAIYLSERLQKRVGYAWWRKLHYLTFGIYGLATVHGLGMGSDTRTQWAVYIYVGSVVLVGGLLALRLLAPGTGGQTHPRVAALTGLAALILSLWTIQGPLRPGWNVLANNGHGSGARVALNGPNAHGAAAGLALPFKASVNGTATVGGDDGGFGDDSGGTTVVLDTQLNNGARGALHVTLQGQPAPGGLQVAGGQVALTPAGGGADCRGSLTDASGNGFTAVCTQPSGQQVQLSMQLRIDQAGAVSGRVQASSV